MNKAAKILIVEDDESINRLINLALLSEGYYNIQKAFDGVTALGLINNSMPDIILLDIMLPELDGLSLCRKIKADKVLKSIPVIMITAKSLEEDVLNGFEAGAVDYITKPFSTKILLARIKAHLTKEIKNILKYGEISLNKQERTLFINNEEIKLTSFEFEITALFLSHIGSVFTRAQLLAYLRGEDSYEISERAVDVQIVNLRKKLGIFGSNIETIRGVGYKLKDLEL